MDTVWANKLINDTTGNWTWARVPEPRKEAVDAILLERVLLGALTPEKYESITGKAA